MNARLNPSWSFVEEKRGSGNETGGEEAGSQKIDSRDESFFGKMTVNPSDGIFLDSIDAGFGPTQVRAAKKPQSQAEQRDGQTADAQDCSHRTRLKRRPWIVNPSLARICHVAVSSRA